MSQYCDRCHEELDWEPYGQLCIMCAEVEDAERGYGYDIETGEKYYLTEQEISDILEPPTSSIIDEYGDSDGQS